MRLALKYRPDTLQKFIGHGLLIPLLNRALATKTLAQSLLLTGSYGIGKTSLARLIAKSLICLSPMDGEACQICASCQAFAQKTHIDVQEIDAASHTGVEDIRLILEGLSYRPLLGKSKVYILDEVHMLSKSAFNALLKTLEEPEPHVTFILATTEYDKVPETIVSRCQHFLLKPLFQEEMVRHLQEIASQEERKISSQALALLAMHAQGSVRDGLGFLEQAFILVPPEQDISDQTIKDLLGIPSREAIEMLLAHLWARKALDAVDQGQLLCAQGKTPETILTSLLQEIYAHSAQVLQGEGYGTLAQWDRLWQIASRGLKEVQDAPMPSLALDMLLMRMAYMGDFPTPDQVVWHMDGLQDDKESKKNPSPKESEKKPVGQETGLKSAQSHTPEKEASCPVEEVLFDFMTLLQKLKEAREAVLHAYLVQKAGFISWQNNTLTLSGVKDEKNSQALEKFLTQWRKTRCYVVWQEEGAVSLRDQVDIHPLWQETKKLFPGAVLTHVDAL